MSFYLVFLYFPQIHFLSGAEGGAARREVAYYNLCVITETG